MQLGLFGCCSEAVSFAKIKSQVFNESEGKKLSSSSHCTGISVSLDLHHGASMQVARSVTPCMGLLGSSEIELPQGLAGAVFGLSNVTYSSEKGL